MAKVILSDRTEYISPTGTVKTFPNRGEFDISVEEAHWLRRCSGLQVVLSDEETKVADTLTQAETDAILGVVSEPETTPEPKKKTLKADG